MSSLLEGKTVLVTGARGGIGQALVKAFLDARVAGVIAADRSPVVAGLDSHVRHIVLDVTDAQAAEKAAAECRVDIVVNNAGVNGNRGMFEPGAAQQCRSEMEVNYFGLFNMARAFSPEMKTRRSGAFVNLLSFAAFANFPSMATYSASKAATRSLTQALRSELGLFGVRVIGVYPRMVDTAMSAHLPLEKTSPHEVAQAVVAALTSEIDDVFPGNAAASYESFLRDPIAWERACGQRLPRSSLAAVEARA